MSDQVTISAYICERLIQLGVKSVFGVPGDFNLEFLDYVEGSDKLDWVGNANELNAAYSADGYARVSKTLACLVTTFGVGELSALCGVAGMMAERLPLLHLVGMPSTKLQGKQAILHHTLGEGRFNEFQAMSAWVSAHTAQLVRTEGAGELIDELITVATRECRPVYLALPTDLIHAKIPSAPLSKPLPTPHSLAPSLVVNPSPSPSTQHVLKTILDMYDAATDPIVLVDAGTSRFGMEALARKLVEMTGMQFFETPMGKAVLDETHPNYGGCYIGANSLPAVRQLVERSDLVFLIGPLASDVNTSGIEPYLDQSKVISLHSDHLTIGWADFKKLSYRELLPLILQALEGRPQKKGSTPSNELVEQAEHQRADASAALDGLNRTEDEDAWGKETITHAYLWPRMSTFFDEHDIIIAESGTSEFGVLDIPYPKTATALSQILWGAIGWSVGACVGAAIAAKEDGRAGRVIVFVGDGSLQLTLQEIGTILRKGLTPTIFVLNNDGYEVERQIHGVDARYNDIQPYDHSLLLDFLAGRSKPGVAKKHAFHRAETRAELDALLSAESFARADVCNLVEIVMPRGDAPRALLNQAKLIAQANST